LYFSSKYGISMRIRKRYYLHSQPLLLDLSIISMCINKSMTTTKSNESVILVTGATGTVGSEVVKQLLSPGRTFRAAVHSITRVPSSDKLRGIELAEIDYNKPETLVAAFKGANRLFLLTPASPKAAELATNLVNEAKKAGIIRIVKQSIIGADSEL